MTDNLPSIAIANVINNQNVTVIEVRPISIFAKFLYVNILTGLAARMI